MAREIDERIVAMRFDNQEFEREAATTMKTVEKLKGAFSDGWQGATESFYTLQDAINHFDLSTVLKNNLGAIAKFKIISDAIDKVTHSVEQAVKAMSVDQFTAGWSKYESKTESVQTIMAATAQDFSDTAEQMEYVNNQLSKLNWFTDETSYNFTDMTSNIGKFTSVGVKLDDAVTAMEGVATWAGISGAKVSEASRAMYNLSQAMGTGAVKLIDWKSIENANMATREFKENVIDVALELGTLKKAADGTLYSGDDLEHAVSVTNFNENLKDGWFSSDVLTTVLKRYGNFTDKLNEYITRIDEETGNYITTSTFIGWAEDFADTAKDSSKVLQEAMDETGMSAEDLTEMFNTLNSAEYELGKRSFKAAQEAKTWTDAFDSVKDAVSTGWMNTFETIFGDYEQAKVLWTNVANELYDVFASGGELRNSILEAWAEMLDETETTGRDLLLGGFGNIWNGFTTLLFSVKDALHRVFLGTDEENEIIDKVATSLMNFSKWFNEATSVFVLSDEAVEQLNTLLDNLLKPLKFIWDTVRAIFDAVSPLWDSIKYGVSVLGPQIKTLINRLFGNFFYGTAIVNEVTSGLKKIFKVASKVINAIIDLVGKLLSIVNASLTRVKRVIENDFNGLKSLPKVLLHSIHVFSRAALKGIGKLISEITGIEQITTLFEMLDDTIGLVTKNISELAEGAKKSFKFFGGGLKGVVKATSYVLRNSFERTGKWLTKVTGVKWFETFGNNAATTIFKVQKKATELIAQWKESIARYGGGIKGVLKTMTQEAARSSKHLFDWLADTTGIEAFRVVGNKVTVFFLGLKQKIDAFSEFLKPIIEKITNLFEPVTSAVKKAFGWLWGDEEVADPSEALADSAEANAERVDVAYKSIKQMALEYIRGDWGNGLERDERSIAAGYNNDAIQNVVNQVWSLAGEWKEGYQEVLDQYENVDARLEKEGKKHYKRTRQELLAESGMIAEAVGKPIRTIEEQTADAKEKILAGLPVLINNIAKGVATAGIKIHETIQAIKDFIETHALIDKFVQGMIKLKDWIVKTYNTIKNTLIKIKNFWKNVFKGTAPMFGELLSHVLLGEWSKAGDKVIEIFEKVKKNFHREYVKFAADISKSHDPISEIVKAVLIAANVIKAAVKGVFGIFTSSGDEATESATGILGIFQKIVGKIKGLPGAFPKLFANTLGIFENLQYALLTSNWTDAGVYFRQMLDQIRQNIRESFPGLSSFLDKIEAIKNGIVNFATTISNLLTTAFAGTGDLFTNLLTNFSIGNFSGIATDISDILSTVWNNLFFSKETTRSLKQGEKEITGKRSFLGSIASGILGVGQLVFSVVGKIIDFLSKSFEGTSEIFTNVREAIAGGDWDGVKKNFKEIFKKIRDNIRTSFPTLSKLIDIFEKIKNVATNVFKTVSPVIQKFATTVGPKVWSGVTTVWDTVKRTFQGVGPILSEALTAASQGDWSAVGQNIKLSLSTVGGNISEMFDEWVGDMSEKHPWFAKLASFGSLVVEKLEGVFEKIKQFFEDHREDFEAFGGKVWEGLEAGWTYVSEAAGGVWSWVSDNFGDLGPILEALVSSILTMDWEGAKTQIIEAFKTIGKAVLEGVGEAISLAGQGVGFLSDIAGGISNLLMSILGGGGEEGEEGEEGAGSIGSLISNFFVGISENAESLGELGENVKQQLKESGVLTDDTLQQFEDTFGVAISKTDEIAGLVKDVRIAQVLGNVNSIGKNVKKATKMLPGIFDNLQKSLSEGGLRRIIHGKTKVQEMAETIKTVASGFLMIAAGITILSTVPEADLEKGMEVAREIVTWLGAGLGITAIVELVSTIKGTGANIGSTLDSVWKIIGAVGVGLYLIFQTVNGFTDLFLKHPIAASAAYTAVIALMGAFAGIIIALETFSKIKTSRTSEGIGAVFKGIAPTILAIAFGVDLLAVAVAAFAVMARLSMGAFWQGVLATILIMGAFTGIIYAIGKFSKNLEGVKALTMIGMILSIALAIILLVIPIKTLGNMDLAKCIQGCVATAAMLIVFAGVVAVFGWICAKIKEVKWGDIIKVLVLMAAAVTSLIFIINTLGSKNIKITPKQAKSLAIVMGTLFGAEGALTLIAGLGGDKSIINIGWSEIFKVLAMLAEALGFLWGFMEMFDKYGKNIKQKQVDTFSSLMTTVAAFVGELAVINMANNGIFKSSGKKGFLNNLATAATSLVSEGGVLVEVVEFIRGILELFSNKDLTINAKWTDETIGYIERIFRFIRRFIEVMAGIDVIGKFLDKSLNKGSSLSFGKKLGNTFIDFLDSASPIVIILGTIWAVLDMFSKYELKESWTNEKIDMVLRMVGIIAAVAKVFNAIDEVGGFLAGIISKSSNSLPGSSSSKSFGKEFGDEVLELADTMFALGPIIGVMIAAMWALSTFEIKPSWTETKIEAVKNLMLAVATVAGAFAGITEVGGFLGSIKGMGYSGSQDLLTVVTEGTSNADKFKGDLMDLVSTVGDLLPVIGTLAAVLFLMSTFPIDDSWTAEKVSAIKGIILAVSACAVALARIPVPDTGGWEQVAASFKAGLAVDAFLAPILGLIELFAAIDGALSALGDKVNADLEERYGKEFNINLSLGGLVERLLKPVEELMDALATSTEKMSTAFVKMDGLEPSKVQPMVDIFELIASMDDNSSKVSNVLTMFTGTNEWTTIAEGLDTMVSSLTGFIVDTEGHDLSHLDEIRLLLSRFIGFVNIINETHAYGFEYNLKDALENYTSLVNSIGTLLDNSNEIDIEKFKTLTELIKEFRDFTSVAAGIQLDEIGSDNTLIGELGDFADYGIFRVILENLTSPIVIEEIKKAFEDLAEECVKGFKSYFSTTEDSKFIGVLKLAGDDFVRGVQTVFGVLTNDSDASTARSRIATIFKNIGKKGAESLRDSFDGTDDKVTNAITAAATNFESLAKPKFTIAGENVVNGLLDGLRSKMPEVTNTMNAMSTLTQLGYTRPMRIDSPSKVMYQYGIYTGEGLINGLSYISGSVGTTASSLGESAVDAMSSIIQNASYMVEESGNPVITPVVDMSNVARNAGYINGMFAGGTYAATMNIENARLANVGAVRSAEYQGITPINYNDTINGIRSDISALSQSIHNMQVVMDSGALVGSIAAPMDAALGRRVVHKARRN